MTAPHRWAVLGTANIARRAFLPALHAAGGRAVVVGSRTPDRAAAWAAANGIDRTADYAAAVADPEVDAVYVALPNDQHLTWTARAAAAGKAVLCEKPFGLDATSVAETVASCGADALVWEAFVFPFHPQTELIGRLIGDGAIGELHEVHSEFHFPLPAGENIRWSREHGGGALYDVGCYPIRLARLLFDDAVTAAGGVASTHDGIDVSSAGALDFAGGGRLVWSAGFARPFSTFTRIIGSGGELRVGNPFHPKTTDTVTLMPGEGAPREWPAGGPGTAFEHAIRHIHAVLDGSTAPRHLIGADAVAQAGAIELARAAIDSEVGSTGR